MWSCSKFILVTNEPYKTCLFNLKNSEVSFEKSAMQFTLYLEFDTCNFYYFISILVFLFVCFYIYKFHCNLALSPPFLLQLFQNCHHEFRIGFCLFWCSPPKHKGTDFFVKQKLWSLRSCILHLYSTYVAEDCGRRLV